MEISPELALTAAGTVAAIMGGCLGAAAKWVESRIQNRISVEVISMTSKIQKYRDEDKEWINGSFMRSKLAEANASAIHERLDRQDRTLERIETRLLKQHP